MILYEPLLNLIKTNKNWKQFLEAEPRFISVKQCTWKKEDGTLECPELYMFSYDGLFSDFNDEYVRLFCGEEGFEYSCTYAINPITEVIIVPIYSVLRFALST